MKQSPGEEVPPSRAETGGQAGVQERDLCVLYGDHDECPYTETEGDGVRITCTCSCHLFPGAVPE